MANSTTSKTTPRGSNKMPWVGETTLAGVGSLAKGTATEVSQHPLAKASDTFNGVSVLATRVESLASFLAGEPKTDGARGIDAHSLYEGALGILAVEAGSAANRIADAHSALSRIEEAVGLR